MGINKIKEHIYKHRGNDCSGNGGAVFAKYCRYEKAKAHVSHTGGILGSKYTYKMRAADISCFKIGLPQCKGAEHNDYKHNGYGSP